MAPISIPGRREAIEDQRAAGGGLAAVFPVHNPRALLRSFGLLPVEVWGPPSARGDRAAAHLQAYTCSLVRCGLSFVLAGGLDRADCIVVPHACDSLQGLGSLLLDFVKPSPPVLPYYLPRGERDVDRAYLTAEIESLAERLARIAGRELDRAELHARLDREEQADRAAAALIDDRRRLGLSNRRLYELLRSREYLPAERFCALADSALEARGEMEAAGVPVLLSGLVPEPASVLDALDAAGACVVADDMACAGRRIYRACAFDDPLERQAARLLSGPPDSTRDCSMGARVAHLCELAERSGARGVIFFDVKFCEPELFYLPRLQAGLREAGLACLACEVDLADALPDQILTRLEAFVEMLS
ncbi:MAG: 2-hydroxyacyl-CoA dehydratase [Deltaproteobacteria bacterium]|nr:2-hydroxyacyl-CoA dehydratase [Deltaproteobacteria bacterium]